MQKIQTFLYSSAIIFIGICALVGAIPTVHADSTSGYTLQYSFNTNGTSQQSQHFDTYQACSQALANVRKTTQVTNAACIPDDKTQTFFCYKDLYDKGYTQNCYQTQDQCNAQKSADTSTTSASCVSQSTDDSGTYSSGVYIAPSKPQNYTFLAPLTDNNGQPFTNSDLIKYIQGMYRLLIGLSAVIAVVMIVYGGVLYMSTDAIGKKQTGKQIIVRTMWGLVLLIGSYLILVTINPTLVGLSLTPGSNNLGTASSTTSNTQASWCTDVSIQTSSTNYPYSHDCLAGPDENACENRVLNFWNKGGPNTTYQASDCQPSNTSDLSQQQWCITPSVSGPRGTITLSQDCSAGLVYMIDSNVTHIAEQKAQYYINRGKTVDQSGSQQQTISGSYYNTTTVNIPTHVFIENNQACIHVHNQDGTVYDDCSAGNVYKLNSVTKSSCDAKVAFWRKQSVTFSASQCYNQNASK